MTKSDPIIAVKDVEASSEWYQSVFGCKSMHGGQEFDILVSENDEVLLCLHKWGEHEHPTLADPATTPGNGLILYFRTDRMEDVRENVRKMGGPVAREVQLNPNSLKREFSLTDPDGYYLTVTEYHRYEG